MPEPDPIYWYEYDVLPIVGFVRAPDAESAEVAALDDAANRLRAFLADSTVRLQAVELTREEPRDAQSSY